MATSLTGCVKWFDNGLNYGFITVLSEGEHKGVDIFVHQSNIKTKRDCYRTLYTGECVTFDLVKSKSETHPWNAENVTGFNGAILHCENPSFRGRVTRGRGGFQGRGGYRGNNTRRPPRQQSETTGETATSETTTNEEHVVQTISTDAVVQQMSDVSISKRGRGRGKRTN